MTSPRAPSGFHFASYPQLGISLRVPDNWRAQAGASPLVATIASGTATVAIWRYPRSEPLPRTPAALATARTALVRAAHRRDRTLKLTTARVTRFRGAPAIVLAGTETVGGRRRTVRSSHVFGQRSEVVVEALAPPPAFAALQRSVFAPLLRSVRIGPLPR